MDNNQWRSVFRQLVARGYLGVDLEGYGALRLQDKCRPLLRGEESLDLRRDPGKTTRKKGTRKAVPDNIDNVLFEALRACRMGLADEQGVPPYVIFHDRSLQEMCAILPRNTQQFGEITGVGESKLEKYGATFLQIINDHLEVMPVPATDVPGR